MVEVYIESEGTMHYACIGAWLVSRAVQTQLGSAITAEAGDIWHIDIGDDGIANGFALSRYVKSRNALHTRFLYVPDDAKPAQDRLIAAIQAHGAELECKSLSALDRSVAAWWKRNRYKMGETRQRSSFVMWEKQIKGKK